MGQRMGALVMYPGDTFSLFRNLLHPIEGEVSKALMDAAGEAERDTFSYPMGQFDILANGVKEWVERISGKRLGSGERNGHCKV
jgi:hypothetical protein